jgi:hypothetical protein
MAPAPSKKTRLQLSNTEWYPIIFLFLRVYLLYIKITLRGRKSSHAKESKEDLKLLQKKIKK